MTFDERVWDSIKKMEKKYDYTPTILIDMINSDLGAIEAVRKLINNPRIPYGYTKLWELKALNLSMEAIVLEEEWKELFSDDERRKARRRLRDYGYKI